MRLHAEHLQRSKDGKPCGPSASEAPAELLSRLRSSALVARADGKDVSAATWRGARLTLTTAAMGPTVELRNGGTLDVLLARDDVVQQWPSFAEVPQTPAAEPMASPTAKVLRAEATQSAPKGRAGGRPEREDWPPFDKEMMRRLALDGGNLTLRAFKRGMKEWAADNMNPVPDDRTIERRIDRHAPADVFAPE